MRGPAHIRRIGRPVVTVETGVLALVLLSCGDSDPAPQSTPTPTPPARLQEPDAGDEQPPAVTVRLRATDEDLTIRPRRVPAFIPLEFVLDNSRGTRTAVFRVPGQPVAEEAAGVKGGQRSAGERPGRLRISAGRGRVAVLRVVAGG